MIEIVSALKGILKRTPESPYFVKDNYSIFFFKVVDVANSKERRLGIVARMAKSGQ